MNREPQIRGDARILAEALGLPEPREYPPSTTGEVAGALVRVVVSADLAYNLGRRRTRAPDRDRRRIAATLPFEPPLEAGLRVVRSFRSPRPRFRVLGAEADRAEALLTQAARDVLAPLILEGAAVLVSDDAVMWAMDEDLPWPDVRGAARPIRALASAWTSIVAASGPIRPTTGTEEALIELAAVARPGIELRGAPSGLVGRIGGVGLAVTVRPAEGGWSTRVVARLPAALPGVPRLVREDELGWLDRLRDGLLGRAELTVGDRAFDQRFAIRGLRADLLDGLLGPAVREAMLRLDRCLPVQLDQHGISATGTLASAGALRDAAVLAQDLAEVVALTPVAAALR
jgi:hypothetical protein